MTETKLYQKIKNQINLKCQIEGWKYHFVRIESPSSQGLPDINCCVNGKEFWIECKVDNNYISPMQASWHMHRKDCGGHVFIVSFHNKLGTYKLYKVGQENAAMDWNCNDIVILIDELLYLVLG